MQATANPHQPPSHTKASTTGIAIAAVSTRWATERFHCLLIFSEAFGCASCSLTGCTRLLIAAFKLYEESRQGVLMRRGNPLSPNIIYYDAERRPKRRCRWRKLSNA